MTISAMPFVSLDTGPAQIFAALARLTHDSGAQAAEALPNAAHAVAGPAGPVNFSIFTMFANADIVVQIIMGGLLFASLWTWAIVINKELELGRARARARRAEESILAGRFADDPNEAAKTGDAVVRVFAAASRELRDAPRAGADGGLQLTLDRAEKAMAGVIDRETLRLENGLGVLATIASATPFVGLLGTVWGIINAFQSIASSQDTSLAVVAPGIAEALSATAIGLFAAIPAVVFYNKFAADIGRFSARLDHFAYELSLRLSRKLAAEAGR